MEVRDPIHGAISIAPDEASVLQHPFVQRLRRIKQMGFSEIPFPGAVHSRYIHSVGAMHLSGRAFDSVFRGHSFTNPVNRVRWRRCVRLAALLHDVGHAPYSHCTEFTMPPLEALGVRAYRPEVHAARGAGRASHEDYTIGIITQTALKQVIDENAAFNAGHVAALISREVVLENDFFVDGGLDYRNVLSQIISSELDVDRMDYLIRDSYFSGARYGQIDVNWLINNLTLHVHEGCASLAVDRRAIYAFDDFMVARYHMFVMVYFHHKSVVLEEMLKRYINGPNCEYALPTDMESYLRYDDVHLLSHLRQSDDPWAQAVFEGRTWKRVLELHGTPQEVDTSQARARLSAVGIDYLSAGVTGKFSRYTVFGQKRDAAPPIFVIDSGPGTPRRVTDLTQATAIFKRYEDERQISRVYVHPRDLDRALEVMATG